MLQAIYSSALRKHFPDIDATHFGKLQQLARDRMLSNSIQYLGFDDLLDLPEGVDPCLTPTIAALIKVAKSPLPE